MIEPSQVCRALSTYLHAHPDESLVLSPLWQFMEQHARAGSCAHRGTCPVIKISPVIVDERGRVLMLQTLSRFKLPEATLTDDFGALSDAAATLARTLGVGQLWKPPGCEDPVHLDPARDYVDGLRTKVAFRYLFRAHSWLAQFAAGAPQVWMPLAEAGGDLTKRVAPLLTQEVR